MLSPGACAGSGPGAERPDPALARTRAAQSAYRRLHERWLPASVEKRRELEPALRAFISEYPDDGRARLVRVYLAWVLIDAGRLEEARSLVTRTRGGPAGSAQDFATVAFAKILVREKRPDRALTLLEPLDGKIVDSHERLAFGEVRVDAALAAERWQSAVDYLLDWLAAAAPEDREAVQQAVNRVLASLPSHAVERGLGNLDNEARKNTQSAERAQARDYLRKHLRERLISYALTTKDPGLARRILEGSPPAVRRSKAGVELAKLAAAASVAPRVAGRSLGLVLSLGSADARRRSAEVAQGMSRALGLIDASSGLKLITRDDQGTAEGMLAALAGLAGDGAAVLAAGVDAEGAARAKRYAEFADIPVLLLAAPEELPEPGSFAFLLGADRDAAKNALLNALKAQGATKLASVGAGGVPCDARPGAAGQPRFPVHGWRRDGIAGLLLLGDARCTRELVAEANAAGFKPLLALGLESAEFGSELTGRYLALGSGDFPFSAAQAPPALKSLRERIGRDPTWFETLGHDAAVLVRAALSGFSEARVDDQRAVAELHERARKQLATAAAELWTSDKRGFAGSRRLPRTLRVIEAGRGP